MKQLHRAAINLTLTASCWGNDALQRRRDGEMIGRSEGDSVSLTDKYRDNEQLKLFDTRAGSKTK